METLVKGTYSRDYSSPLDVCPAFVIHPETSALAEELLIDPQALANENYSGIYDEGGDYIPQYAENPDEVPRGSMVANSADATSGTAGGGAEDPGNGNESSESAESSAEPTNQ